LALRGYLYRKKGDLDRAIVDYGEMIRIDPKSDDAYMRRSEAWLAKGDRLAALRDADEAVKLDPNAPVNYAARATVMRALNRNDDAIADLRKALALNPTEARKRQIEGALKELGATP
jgi:tetratricopeptide (TPR) repeat protein